MADHLIGEKKGEAPSGGQAEQQALPEGSDDVPEISQSGAGLRVPSSHQKVRIREPTHILLTAWH
ncbi:hypothetical protein VTH06DRAFT_7303 [Thermothelomyces fergusii]